MAKLAQGHLYQPVPQRPTKQRTTVWGPLPPANTSWGGKSRD